MPDAGLNEAEPQWRKTSGNETLIRGVKGVVIGQILVAIIGYGELFELYSRSFDMERFWALSIVLFAAAMLLSRIVERVEKRIEYYAGAR